MKTIPRRRKGRSIATPRNLIGSVLNWRHAADSRGAQSMSEINKIGTKIHAVTLPAKDRPRRENLVRSISSEFSEGKSDEEGPKNS
jgi:hypothetical protein